MIENFLVLLYNDSMPKYVKTTEYSFETFVADLNKNSITQNDVLTCGFKFENGLFRFVKNALATRSYIVLEGANQVENLFPIALAIKSILRFYHISNIGILLGDDKVIEEYLNNFSSVDVLFFNFSFNHDPNFMPCDNVLLGKCKFEISPYPNLVEGKEELISLADKLGLSCEIINDKIVGEKYYSEITDLESKLLDFSRTTCDFDNKYSVVSRVFIKDITLPVKNNEYYADLFSFLPKKQGGIEYKGRAGNVLDKHNGATLCVNIDNDKNIESFFKCVKTYLEDING